MIERINNRTHRGESRQLAALDEVKFGFSAAPRRAGLHGLELQRGRIVLHARVKRDLKQSTVLQRSSGHQGIQRRRQLLGGGGVAVGRTEVGLR